MTYRNPSQQRRSGWAHLRSSLTDADFDLNRGKSMRVAYLTADEVNVELARQWAAECGGHLQRIRPKDGVPYGRFDAVCYDLDDVPRERRAEILLVLLSGPITRPTAVHGYGLDDDQIGRLR